MGGCSVTFGFGDKIKTAQQALKDANERGEQDRYENGHSYSGTMGMLHLRVINRVFDTVDDFCDFTHTLQKDDGVIAQVRVVRETKPLQKALQDKHNAEWALDGAKYRRHAFRDKPATPAQLRRLQDKFAKAEAKYRALLAKQVAKSTKTRFIGGGIASS